eukprot:496462_1
MSRSERIKKYLQSYNEHQLMERKYGIFPPNERRCKVRNSFMDKNALMKACSEKIRCIGEKQIGPHEREYTICSAKGDIYYVIIGEMNYCTCHRFSNKTIQCKHILYVENKIIKIPIGSHILYQNGLLISELKEIFSHGQILVVDNSNKSIMRKYHMLKNKGKKSYVRRKPIQMDYCRICLSLFKEGDQSITWCRSNCGANVHIECKEKKSNDKCFDCGAIWLYAYNVEYMNVFK